VRSTGSILFGIQIAGFKARFCVQEAIMKFNRLALALGYCMRVRLDGKAKEAEPAVVTRKPDQPQALPQVIEPYAATA
jgi:hypothetical protein